jgi:DNA-binding IscR family transcriptional regulator
VQGFRRRRHLTLLAHEEGRALTSEHIAGNVNINPVVIRRLLGQVGWARLVSTTERAGGGTTLARPAGRITLGDMYQAVEPASLFGATRNDPNPQCPVGRSVQTVLQGHLERFGAALEGEMDKITVADVLAGVRSRARR